MVEHPYKQLEGTELWRVLETAIEDLVLNGDIDEKTPRHYIVGYIATKLVESGLDLRFTGLTAKDTHRRR